MIYYNKGGSSCFRKGGQITERGTNKLGGPGAMPPLGKILENLVANGAFWINLDHLLRAEISPIFSQYFVIKCPPTIQNIIVVEQIFVNEFADIWIFLHEVLKTPHKNT